MTASAPASGSRGTEPPWSDAFAIAAVEEFASLATAGDGDLWPSAWADDDGLYAACGDGLGFADGDWSDILVNRIDGTPATGLSGERLSSGRAVAPVWTDPSRFNSKPTGMVAVDGNGDGRDELYLAVQDLRCGESPDTFNSAPAAGIVRSDDYGRTWHHGDGPMFTGEYYRQVLEDGDPHEFQWETGCLSDQLIGQWWAHVLGLGYVLPAEHVRTALSSVLRHNLRVGLEGFEHPFRTYADGDETGLLMCTWPTGGLPEVPTRYCDEVWTGVEYQVAAHLELEGMAAESRAVLDGVWGRYDGRRRNPYNEIECGDHYVRALSGWSVLETRTGQRWDALTRTLSLRAPQPGSTWPIVLDQGWGQVFAAADGGLTLRCDHGTFAIDQVRIDRDDARTVSIRLVAGESTAL